MPVNVQVPSLDSLRCFLAGAKHLNFRQAAQEVYLTPTAFGQRIKHLEELLERPLFNRTTRRVALTREGHSLVPAARETLDGARRCTEVVLAGEEPPVHLMVGTRFELGLSWLLPSLLALESERPSWRMDTYFGAGPDIIGRLRAGELDCVVTSAPIASAEWTAHVLHPEEYVLVGSPELLERLPFETPGDAKRHMLLDVDRELPLSRYLAAANNPKLMFGDVRLCGAGAPVVLLARLGIGVAVLPEYMVAEDLQKGTLKRLLPELPLLKETFRLLCRRDHPFGTSLESLADFLRQRPLVA